MLTPGQKVIVSTLMPISIMWQDFMDKHEYRNPSVPITITPDAIMKLIVRVNHYIAKVYTGMNLSNEDWDAIYKEVMPLMQKGAIDEQSNNVDGVTRVWEDYMGKEAGREGRSDPNQQGRPTGDDAQQPPLGEERETDSEGEGQSDDPSPAVR